ncbi:MAG TPA: Na+/H+ antiporter subunit E [Rubrobacteraceae bacterium]|nr:Na+/H+ antiporter subunit E [Rubrobacteraceae bacterium]
MSERQDHNTDMMEVAPAPGLLDQVVFWVVSWVLLTGLYLLLVVDSIDISELVMGAVAAAVGATAATAVRSQRLVSFRPRLRWALGLWRLPLQATLDTGVLVAVLWRRLVLRRPVDGSFRAVPFRLAGDEPEAAARRAIAKGVGSVAPNTYVLDVDRERELILVHQLVPKPDQPRSIDPLELG